MGVFFPSVELHRERVFACSLWVILILRLKMYNKFNLKLVRYQPRGYFVVIPIVNFIRP